MASIGHVKALPLKPIEETRKTRHRKLHAKVLVRKPLRKQARHALERACIGARPQTY